MLVKIGLQRVSELPAQQPECTATQLVASCDIPVCVYKPLHVLHKPLHAFKSWCARSPSKSQNSPGSRQTASLPSWWTSSAKIPRLCCLCLPHALAGMDASASRYHRWNGFSSSSSFFLLRGGVCASVSVPPPCLFLSPLQV